MRNNVLRIAFILVIGLIVVDIYFMAFKRTTTALEPRKLGPIVRLVEGGKTFCTGTVVAKNAILTAAHCVLGESPYGVPVQRRGIEVRPSNNTPVNTLAEVFTVRYQMDQSILMGDFSKFQVAPYIPEVRNLTNKSLLTRKMTACGYPLGGPLFCTTIYFKEMYQFMWKVNGVLIPGMSGGPVFLSTGEVVATNDAVDGDSAIVSPIYTIDLDLPGGS